MNKHSTWLSVVVYRLGQVRQQLGFVVPLSVEDQQEVQRWLPASALPLFSTMSNADQQHSLRVCRGLQAQGCIEHAMLAAALLHDVGKAQGRVPFWTRPVIVIGKLFAPRLLARVVIPFSQLGTDNAMKQKNHVVHGQGSCVVFRRDPIDRVRGVIYHARSFFHSLQTRMTCDTSHADAVNGVPTTDQMKIDNVVGAILHYALVPIRNACEGVMKYGPYRVARLFSRASSIPTRTLLPAWRRSLSYAWWHADVGANLAAEAGLSEQAVLYIRTHHEPHGPAAALHRVDEVS